MKSRAIASFLLAGALVPGLFAGPARAQTPGVDIDLTALVWQAALGFAPPAAPAQAGRDFREVASFPIMLNRVFPPGAHSQIRKFTVFTRFSLSEVDRQRSLALHLPAVGENWTLFLNGRELRNEMYLDEEGRMTRRRTLRARTVPLPAEALVTGENLLLFHIVGESSLVAFVPHVHPGFYVPTGYRLADHHRLVTQSSDIQRIILMALYLFFGFYHFVLFAGRRSERYNLYFALFAVTLAIYLFIRSPQIYDLLGDRDTEPLYRLDYFIVFLFLPFFFRFMHYYFFADRPIFWFIRLNTWLYALFCAAVLVVPFSMVVVTLRLWQYSVLVFAPFMIYLIGLAIRERKRDSLLLSASIVLMLFSTVWDITAAIFLFSSQRYFEYSFFAFVMAIVVIIARRFLRLHRELEQLNLDLSTQRQEFYSLNQNLEEEIELRTQKYLQAKQEAEEAARTKSAFLANMSHEIRTPLNAVLGMGELLAESRLDENQNKYLAILRRAGTGLLALVNDILDISKIEAGQLDIESAPVNLRDLAGDTVEILAPEAQRKGLRLDAEVAPELPAYCLGDYARLRQILLNLLGNAIKFTERGEVELRLRRGRAENEDFVDFFVRDTGIGIPPEQQERIFESFAQADTSTTRIHGGTGLGLTISRRLAQSMQGTITLKSQPGAGSEFCLRLPFAPAEGDAAGARPARLPASNWDGRLRILLAEDNPDNALLFQIYLKKAPCEIRTARNGIEAERLFREERFDVIFMDIQMPELDGLEATRRIRRREAEQGDRQRTPIFALTANAFEEDVRNSLEAGCDGHLTKPFSRDDLLGILAEIQKGKQQTESTT